MISVITITYNNPDELKETLRSIPAYDFVESVIVNGGDDQRTAGILKEHRGKVINEKDKGIADAFNKGILISSGSAVMFLNSGDILLDQEYLQQAERILSQNKLIDFVHSNLLFIDEGGNELFMRPPMKNPGRGMPYLHPTMIVRRSVFDDLGLFNLNYKIAMDFDLIVRMVKKGSRGFYLDKPDAVVIMDGSGASVVKEGEAIKECFISLRKNDYLTIPNLLGYLLRITLFMLRKFLVKIKAGKFLLGMKQIKHSR